MRHVRTRAVLLVCLVGAAAAADDLLAYDGFAYGTGRLAGQSAGQGWSGAWADGHNQVVAEGLASRLGQTPLGAGGRMRCTNPDWASTRALVKPVGEAAGTWYLSFLVANDAEQTREHYITLTLGSGKGALAFGKSWMGKTWGFSAPKAQFSTAGCDTKAPILVVLKVVYADGPAADKVMAYLDPELPAEPRTADVELTGVDLPVGDRISLVAKQQASFDEIRIGTTWAAVCPAK